MVDKIRQLIEEHHAYYEILPYYVVVEEGHGSPAATTRRIQAGFDIDIYGTRIKNDPPWQSHNYRLGYAELVKLAEETSHHPSDSCSIEVIPFLSNIFLDAGSNFQPQAMLRIRVSHRRGLDQPAGPAEEHALGQIEMQLHDMGIRFGNAGSR
jgi:hypothetical protein